jgi:hypothetical protein
MFEQQGELTGHQTETRMRPERKQPPKTERCTFIHFEESVNAVGRVAAS